MKPNPIRVMHFADTHFGVENYGRLDPATGLNSRLLDFKRSLSSAIEVALDAGVHLAVFSGDAYKSRDPSQTHQREFAECIRQLTARGVPVVMLTGNHDIPNARGRAHAMEIYGTLGVTDVHIAHKPDLFVVETSAGPVQLAAMPYLMRGSMPAREELQGKSIEQAQQAMEARYAECLQELAQRADPALPTILMGHFWVRTARLSHWQQGYFNVHEPQVELKDLARPEFDYVALGHIHRHQDLNRGSLPPVVYSGSPDCIDFGEREEKKGFVLVNLVKGGATYEFMPAPASRPFLEIDVNADNESPTEAILEAIAQYDLRDSIVRLTYHTSAEYLPLIREKDVRDALAAAFLIVAIRRDVHRDQTARSKALTETLDPMAALNLYLEQDEKRLKRKDALMPYADLLLEELRREEALK